MIQSCANKLVSDVETDGEVVMDILRKQYKSLYSLDAKASNVRQTVISQGSFSSEYNDFELRTKYGNEAAVVKFLNATLKEKCSIRRAYKYCDPPFSIGAMNALLKMQILPRAMNSFHMTSSEMVELKTLKDQAILNKNNTLILIPDAAALLKSAIRWLEIVSIRSSDAQIVLPLLLVSGRRESEICNGNSLFNPSDLGPTYCVFSGQLKTKSEIDRPFTIPLLIDYSLFMRGLNIWRQKRDQSTLSKRMQTYVQNIPQIFAVICSRWYHSSSPRARCILSGPFTFSLCGCVTRMSLALSLAFA